MISDNARAGMQQAPARSLFNALGFTPEEMKKPMVGIVSSFNEIVPGHMNIDKIVEAVKLGVAEAGGVPVVFPAIAVCGTMGAVLLRRGAGRRHRGRGRCDIRRSHRRCGSRTTIVKHGGLGHKSNRAYRCGANQHAQRKGYQVFSFHSITEQIITFFALPVKALVCRAHECYTDKKTRR